MQITGLQKEEIAYMGDDLNDIKIMKKVGFSGTLLDGVNEAKIIADFVSTKNGGEGAVREFIETILKKDKLFQKFPETSRVHAHRLAGGWWFRRRFPVPRPQPRPRGGDQGPPPRGH